MILKTLAMVFIFVCNLAYSSELWVNTHKANRLYLSIEKTDTGLNLNQYFQENGEFQSLIHTYTFKTKKELDQFVAKKFSEYKTTNKLDNWEIKKNISEDSAVIKLFGKKNDYLWQAKNIWNDEWEAKYGEWLQTEVDPDFFKKHNIQTDCADALVGLRWIFSRMNYLPVANTVADTGKLFGHFSMKKEWRKYQTAANWYEDELFLAALDYIMNLTSTRTVIHDGFPVKIDKKGLVAGTFIITQNSSSGHAKIISETHYTEITELPLYTLASTSPRAIRSLSREVFADQDWPGRDSKEILAFRWPILVNDNWILQAVNARSTYSLEQFDSVLRQDFPAFIQFVFSRVKESYDPLKLVDLGVNDILNYAKQRIQIIILGYEYCRNHDCRPGSQGDDDWGTQSRDAKFLKKFHDIDTMVLEFENLSPGLFARWTDGLRNTTVMVEGVELKLSSLRYIMENNFYSSNAYDTPARRWGLNANELLSTWFASIEKLLAERNAVINRNENPCSKDCFPKTNLWLSLNTYHIDADLNKLYTQVHTYCALVATQACQLSIATGFTKKFDYNSENKTLKEWFNRIPLFHSDPRAEITRRWGNIPSSLQARILPYFDSIKISVNSLALLDSSKVMDLKTGKIIYQSFSGNRLILSKAGDTFKIDDENGEIARMYVHDETVDWVQIKDPDQLLKLEKKRLVYVEEDKDYLIFRKPLTNGMITFRIKNDEIEFIKEHSGATSKKGPLVIMALEKNKMSFIDLDRTIDIEIEIPLTKSFYNINLLQISSYTYPNVILNYHDRDQDLYYTILVDLEKKTWKKMAPSIEEKYITLWSSAELKKAIIKTNFNQEIQNILTVSWDDQNQFKIDKLSNLLLDIKQDKDSVYFIEGTGGVWDQNPKTRLFHWEKVMQVLESPAHMKVSFLTDFGAYFSSDEEGSLMTYAENILVSLPRNLLKPQEFCQIQKGTEQVFNYRFNTSYGDYSCMGGGILKSALRNSNNKFLPQFTYSSWTNSENMLDNRWQKVFSSFAIDSGVLVSIGKNMGLWWSQNE